MDKERFKTNKRENWMGWEEKKFLPQGMGRPWERFHGENCGFSWIPGNVQGKAGEGLDQPGLVEGVCDHGRVEQGEI